VHGRQRLGYGTEPMQPLEYQTPRRINSDVSTPSDSASLTIVPLIATAMAIATSLYDGVQEPFGEFGVWDAIIHVGNLLVTVGLWSYWVFRAYRGRISLLVFVPLVLWAGLLTLVSLWLAVGYFNEPWNA